MMIIADSDTITPTDIVLCAFERAREPKKIIVLQGDHYVPYLEALATSFPPSWESRAEHSQPPDGSRYLTRYQEYRLARVQR
jgi:hypothetical protein